MESVLLSRVTQSETQILLLMHICKRGSSETFRGGAGEGDAR